MKIMRCLHPDLLLPIVQGRPLNCTEKHVLIDGYVLLCCMHVIVSSLAYLCHPMTLETADGLLRGDLTCLGADRGVPPGLAGTTGRGSAAGLRTPKNVYVKIEKSG